ncbi:MAG: DUF4263 domain-containing protein [Candidatus Marinimicrobia bacterium]|nr:DUF4263 domain-containing protein [Candidatus Neomarinimicrobiota bacterium]
MSSNVREALEITLREKKTVATKAVFWKIPHNDPTVEDIRLKLGRYKKSGTWLNIGHPTVETADPKSELTLDSEEFNALIDLLRTHYEPFKQGVKSFIPLDGSYSLEMAEQIKTLFSSGDSSDTIQFIIENNLISDELDIGLRNARRARAISEFEQMLEDDLLENHWQKWFENNSWVLGSEFVRVLDQRKIDTSNITDFLMQAHDGFLDIVELKRPSGSLKFWAGSQDHDNWIPSQDLIKAITQASNYIFEVERESNSVKFLESVDGVRTVKPRGILVFGRSFDWSLDQRQAYRLLNSSFHNVSILTYDHVLARAKRIVGITT